MAKAKDTVDEPKETETPELASADQGDGLVTVTITKFGDGQVSTGVHEAGFGDIYAKRGESLRVAPKVAGQLEALGFAETA